MAKIPDSPYTEFSHLPAHVPCLALPVLSLLPYSLLPRLAAAQECGMQDAPPGYQPPPPPFQYHDSDWSPTSGDVNSLVVFVRFADDFHQYLFGDTWEANARLDAASTLRT